MIFRNVLLGGLFIALAASAGAVADPGRGFIRNLDPGSIPVSRLEASGLMITNPVPWFADKGIPARRNSIFIVSPRTKTSVLTNNTSLDRALRCCQSNGNLSLVWRSEPKPSRTSGRKGAPLS